MKRILIVILLLFSMILVACGGDVEPESAETQTEGVAALPTPTLAPQLPQPTLPPPVIEESTTTDTKEEPTLVEEEVVEPSIDFSQPWSTDDFGYGVQVHGNATVGDPADVMDSVRNELGMEWVKMQMQWFVVERPDAEQWFFYDGVIDEAHKNGLRLMVSIVSAPEWTRAAGTHNGPPDDYADYVNFLNKVLDRYEGKIDAIEVWNEQNLDREWATANGVNPEDYVRFLQLAYDTIKAKDPNIIVISGALAPTGGGDWVAWIDDLQWLDRALIAGMLNYADCVGTHHNGYNIGPNVAFDEAAGTAEAATAVFRGPFGEPHHSWSFKTTLNTYAEKVQAIDPNKKLCVTEFGWASAEGYDEYPRGFEFAQDNTLQEQADNIVQAYQQMHASGDVWLAFMFNYDFGNKGGGPTDDPVPYSIIDTNGVPRPAFGAVAGMEKPR